MSAEHLDFVATVDVASRENSLYVFERQWDAERFAQAVGCGSGPDSDAFVSEQPVNAGEAAERLIAAERADVLADLGWEAVAEDIREGVPPQTVAERLVENTMPRSLSRQIQEWIELDREGGPRIIPALALQPGQRVKAPGAHAWSSIRSVELDEQITARLVWGSLVYEPGELVEVAEQVREVECPLCGSNDVTEVEEEQYCEVCRDYFA